MRLASQADGHRRFPEIVALAAMLAALAAGCAEQMSSMSVGSSPGYLQGFNDGCSNSSSAASNLTGQGIRDESRYVNDPEYAAGWRNGNRECSGESLGAGPASNAIEQVDIDGPQ